MRKKKCVKMETTILKLKENANLVTFLTLPWYTEAILVSCFPLYTYTAAVSTFRSMMSINSPYREVSTQNLHPNNNERNY